MGAGLTGEGKGALAAAVLPEPFLLLRGRHTGSEKLRTASTPLHSLLDYDRDDRDEGSFELSLAAEALHALISRDYAALIMAALAARRPVPLASEGGGIKAVLPENEPSSKRARKVVRTRGQAAAPPAPSPIHPYSWPSGILTGVAVGT
ncbi:hypothetical protein V8C86DRAFT_110904 [Haematococcus lacustris]